MQLFKTECLDGCVSCFVTPGRATKTIENYVNGVVGDSDDKTVEYTYHANNQKKTLGKGKGKGKGGKGKGDILLLPQENNQDLHRRQRIGAYLLV